MKQFILFGLTTTSSFTGYNLCRSINVCEVSPAILNAIPASPRDVSIEPKVLSENKKLTGSENFNTRNYLLLNAEYLKQYREKIKEIPISKLLNIYYQNLIIYLQPSSNYNDSNKLLNFLPSKWRSTYEIIFSYPYLVILLFFSVLIWVFRSDTKKLKGLVISLPVFLIFITSILFESGENMRFKFFIEPIIYIFICSQLYFIGCKSFNFLKQK
jgi:hypothetical protein